MSGDALPRLEKSHQLHIHETAAVARTQPLTNILIGTYIAYTCVSSSVKLQPVV